jgi:hypothetical protein
MREAGLYSRDQIRAMNETRMWRSESLVSLLERMELKPVQKKVAHSGRLAIALETVCS